MVPALRSLQGVSGPSYEDSRSIISPPFLPSLPVSFSLCDVQRLPLALSTTSRGITSSWGAAERQRRQEGKERDRRNASGRDFLPFSVAVEFPLLILSWERRPITGAAPVLYLHPPRCHFHCHSVCKETTERTFWEMEDLRFKNEKDQRDIELTKEGLTSAALPSLMLLIICH